MLKIKLYPTADIHLLESDKTLFKLIVTDVDDPGFELDLAETTTAFNEEKITVKIDGNKITFKAKAIGVTIGRIKYTESGESYEILVRVSTHNSIQKFWSGNNQVTIHQGEANYVLSVFAQFDDGSVGDVSGHHFLNFSVTSPAPLGGSISVDNSVADKGRVAGLANTGTSAINVRITHATLPPQNVGIKVRGPLTTLRNIIEPVRINGSYKEKRNILILSEGFIDTATDRRLFSEVVSKLDQNLFDTNQQTPYDIIKDSFNVWKAFISSSESGVTISSPLSQDGRPIPSSTPNTLSDRTCSPIFYSIDNLIEWVGLPGETPPATLEDARALWTDTFGESGFDQTKVDQTMFDFWKTQIHFGFTQARDSFFGLTIGGRYGERLASSGAEKDNKFYLSGAPARTIRPDIRRRGRHDNRHLFYYKFLSSLRLLSGDVNDVNWEVYKSWVNVSEGNNFWQGEDYPLVCFITNDHRYAARNFGPLAITLTSDKVHPTHLVNSGPKMDHVPSLTFNPNHSSGVIDIRRSSSVMAHEYAHSLNIFDEYEAYDDSANAVFPDDSDTKDKMKRWQWNLTHFFDMKKPAPTSSELDADKTPWNWHRMLKVTTSTKPAFNQGTTEIVVRMKPGEGVNWLSEKGNRVEVFLRHPDMNRDTTDRSKGIEGPLIISRITPNSAGDVFVLDGRTRVITGDNSYPSGSLLFVPVKDGSTILTTVDPAVIAHINANGGKPFMNKSDCTVCSDSTGFPPTDIQGYSYPANHFEVIGLYQGGGTYNCRVYRSSGDCKMRSWESRNRFWVENSSNFSFIVKYILVNNVDPTKLPLLNSHYPS